VRLYVDSSAAIKRVMVEPESDALVAHLERCHADGDVFLASTIAWIEVTRALRSRLPKDNARADRFADLALSGIAEQPLSAEVVNLARKLNPPVLRTLDAIHLASALLIGADEVATYDDRLAAACAANGLATVAP